MTKTCQYGCLRVYVPFCIKSSVLYNIYNITHILNTSLEMAEGWEPIIRKPQPCIQLVTPLLLGPQPVTEKFVPNKKHIRKFSFTQICDFLTHPSPSVRDCLPGLPGIVSCIKDSGSVLVLLCIMYSESDRLYYLCPRFYKCFQNLHPLSFPQ